MVRGRLTVSVIHKFLLASIQISPKPLTRCFLQKKISWLKKFPRKKSYFVKCLWNIIADHQSLETERTLTNESAEYHLSEEPQYLAIPTEVWYQWPYEDRMEYIKFLRSLGKKRYRKSKNHWHYKLEQQWKKSSASKAKSVDETLSDYPMFFSQKQLREKL